ncbi:metallophosphoesterase [Clostridium bowmanii]|uniref:metallophosphoesterase n=1 Tax=Clostridium bowmanii TaxID=132925 RepID=UPI001C0B0034|nr:metallophosphoesterase [Clostridium bowmanii]MBU3188249.1 metallophosphoesterase [Clostridium bowmanii]MCA1072635.1 metallophosphoesterase [Clostridium bowmanii]
MYKRLRNLTAFTLILQMTVSFSIGYIQPTYAVDEPIVETNINLVPEKKIDNDGKFKIALLPDTQVYAVHYPEIFNDQTQWLADNFKKDDIKFAMHLGDVVDGGTEAEWKNATAAMDTLDNNKVPYGVTIGNHDLSINHHDFVKYFGKSKAQDNPGFIECSDNEMNSAYTFEAEGRNFLVIFLDIDASNDELAFAQTVVDRYPNNPTIVVTHTLIGPEGDMASKPYTYKCAENNSPEQIWEKFISKNNQIFMTVNGHDQGANNIVRNNDAGLEVYQYLVDYQGGTKGGNGFLRVIELDLNDNRINHSTYSPTINEFKTDGKNKFSDKCEFERRLWNSEYLGVKSTNKFEGNKTQVTPVSSRGEWIAFDLGKNTTLTDLLIR